MVEDNLDFDYEDGVSLRGGCGLTLHGQMWYLGGDTDKSERQVSSKEIKQTKIIDFKKSKIDGCKMIRQEDDLPFNFYKGSCNTFAAPEEKALLCFTALPFENRNGCYL